MRPVHGLLVLAAGLAIAMAADGQEHGPPPDPLERMLPGRAAGTIRTAWIAPYVQETQVMVGEGLATDVRWFRPDGTVRREVHNPPTGTNRGPQPDAEPRTVRGIRDTWSVRLREVPGAEDGSIQRTEDDSTLVHSWVTAGSIHADVYKDGKLVGSVGPYPRRLKMGEFVLGDDGSMGVLTLKGKESDSVRVVVFAPGGNPTFEADASGDPMIVAVAPGGRGAVLQANGEEYDENKFTWYSKEGASKPLKIAPNPWFTRWVPGTSRALVTYGLGGKNSRFRLVDWESGKTVWDVADPAEGVASRFQGIVVEGDLVLLAGLECRVLDGAGNWRRAAQALDLATGGVVARWASDDTGPPGYSVPRFMRVDGKLWLVADDAFAPFPVEDVRKKANGWR